MVEAATKPRDDEPRPDEQQPAGTTDPAPDLSPEPDLDDVDNAELAEARKALDEAPPATEQAGQPAEQPPAAQPQPTGKPAGKPDVTVETVMVPKARLDEVLRERAEAERRATYLQGALDAQRMAPGAARPPAEQPAAQAPPSPEQRIGTVKAQRLALAKKYDDGEIDAAEFRKQDDAYEDQIWNIRQETLRPASQPAPRQTPANDLYLEEVTERLEAQHPYTTVLADTDMQFLVMKAKESLTAEGVRLGNDPRSLLLLRKRTAELSDTFGPMLTGKQLQPATSAANAGTPTQPAGMSAQAQARANKLALAASHPADIQNLGGPGQAAGVPTQQQIAAMSDEEIAALPESTRARIMSG